MLVAIQDIAAHKKAKDYLYYLGTHDVLTGLHDRAYFQETLIRLKSQRPTPLSVIVADLNNLKQVNNRRLVTTQATNCCARAAEVLKAAIEAGGTDSHAWAVTNS